MERASEHADISISCIQHHSYLFENGNIDQYVYFPGQSKIDTFIVGCHDKNSKWCETSWYVLAIPFNVHVQICS